MKHLDTQYNYHSLLPGKIRLQLPGSTAVQAVVKIPVLAKRSSVCLLLLLALISNVHAQQAETKKEAKEAAIEQLGGDAKALSVKEKKRHFKVKVLADGKVSVIIINKPELADPAKSNNE